MFFSTLYFWIVSVSLRVHGRVLVGLGLVGWGCFLWSLFFYIVFLNDIFCTILGYFFVRHIRSIYKIFAYKTDTPQAKTQKHIIKIQNTPNNSN